jgi:hypothetical protein
MTKAKSGDTTRKLFSQCLRSSIARTARLSSAGDSNSHPNSRPLMSHCIGLFYPPPGYRTLVTDDSSYFSHNPSSKIKKSFTRITFKAQHTGLTSLEISVRKSLLAQGPRTRTLHSQISSFRARVPTGNISPWLYLRD